MGTENGAFRPPLPSSHSIPYSLSHIRSSLWSLHGRSFVRSVPPTPPPQKGLKEREKKRMEDGEERGEEGGMSEESLLEHTFRARALNKGDWPGAAPTAKPVASRRKNVFKEGNQMEQRSCMVQSRPFHSRDVSFSCQVLGGRPRNRPSRTILSRQRSR